MVISGQVSFWRGTSSKKLLVTKGIASRSKKLLVAPGLTTRNKKLLGTSATLVVTGALLVVTRSY